MLFFSFLFPSQLCALRSLLNSGCRYICYSHAAWRQAFRKSTDLDLYLLLWKAFRYTCKFYSFRSKGRFLFIVLFPIFISCSSKGILISGLEKYLSLRKQGEKYKLVIVLTFYLRGLKAFKVRLIEWVPFSSSCDYLSYISHVLQFSQFLAYLLS